MKHRIYCLLVMLFALTAVTAQTLLEKYARQLTLPKGYVCYRTNGPLNIDGRLDEADWQHAPTTDHFVDISGRDYPTPRYTTQVKMLWDDQYFYVGATLQEPRIKALLQQRDTIVYKENDFEVFLDPDGDGQQYFEFETNARATLFDLLLDRPYRVGGSFLIPWDCNGIQLATHIIGTLNKNDDIDKEWSVEMAIPKTAITQNFTNPLQAGNYWRVNFSRVEWLKDNGPEENWVWQPTGRIDMHMPERWGFVYLSPFAVTHHRMPFQYPYNMDAYRLLWAMYYAQAAHHRQHNNYLRDLSYFHLSPAELALLPEGATIDVDATRHQYLLTLRLPQEQLTYTLTHRGEFKITKNTPRTVKNWMWMRLKSDISDADYLRRFTLMKECGISGVLFEGYDQRIYRLCHEAGLEAHYWKWTLNRHEVREMHPEWFAVNRKGESCYDHPAYVDYYRFLCPNHEGVAQYLADDYIRIAHLPYVDGVHLDYVRFPDVILPVNLWKNYGIEQTTEHPEYDYCYCELCRRLYKEQTGVDPLKLQYPSASASWQNFRLNSVSRVVDSITSAVKREGIFISSAVFPGPSMAKKMVRQDWGNWSLDAYFPMIYNGFYNEGPSWIGASVRESVSTLHGKASLYAGLFFPDIKNQFEEALTQAYSNGASGVSFFDGPTDEYLLRLKRYLQEHHLKVAPPAPAKK